MNNGMDICRAERIYEEQIVRVLHRAFLERFELTASPIPDDVKPADILSGGYGKDEGGKVKVLFTSETEKLVEQMKGRLEAVQRNDFVERDRAFGSSRSELF